MNYTPQKGDICRWTFRDPHVQEYDGQQWSDPCSLRDLVDTDPAHYLRVVGTQHMEIVHRDRKQRITYYRHKAPDTSPVEQ